MSKSTATVASSEPKPAEFSRIVKRADPPKREAKQPKGQYRVIHGTLAVPLFADPVQARNARENGQPTQDTAKPGDIVFLNEDDATRLLADNIVETLDAKPSRVGKVWEPPKPVRNKNLGTAPASH